MIKQYLSCRGGHKLRRQMTSDEAIKRWDWHAEELTRNYTEQGDVHREVLLNPAIFSLIEKTTSISILDAGCGEGYLSRILANKGVIVTAVDYSEKMLKLATTKTSSDLNIRYFQGNCENLDFLDSDSVDMIISNMVIQDLANYEAAFGEMYRLLKKDGYFIFSILHPCFVTPKSGWVKNTNGDKVYWKVDNYFYEGVYEQPFPVGAENKVLFYHRTLSSYFQAIQKAGFNIEDIVEPKPSEEMLMKYPFFEEDLNISNFIVFKLRK